MQKQSTNEMDRVIKQTACKTLVITAIVIVLVLSLYFLLAPVSAGNFLYSIGIKKLAAQLTYTGAERSGATEDYYGALVQSLDADAAITYAAAKKILAASDASDFFSQRDEEMQSSLGGTSYSTEKFIRFQLYQSGVLLTGGENKDLWAAALSAGERYYNYNSTVRGYVSAYLKSDSLKDVETVLARLQAIYKKSNTSGYGQFSGWYLSSADTTYGSGKYTGYQNLCYDALEIIRKYNITGEIAELWKSNAIEQGIHL